MVGFLAPKSWSVYWMLSVETSGLAWLESSNEGERAWARRGSSATVTALILLPPLPPPADAVAQRHCPGCESLDLLIFVTPCSCPPTLHPCQLQIFFHSHDHLSGQLFCPFLFMFLNSKISLLIPSSTQFPPSIYLLKLFYFSF